MCMADDSSYTEAWSSQTVIARKAHQCGECGREILAGEPYMRYFGKCEGDVFHGKMCSHCEVLADWLQSNCHGYVTLAIIEDVTEHVSDYRRMDLARLVVGARNGWRTPLKKTPMPIPKLPRPIQLGDAH